MRMKLLLRCWSVAVLLALVVPAASYAGGLTQNGTQPGLTHPLESSVNCNACHAGWEPALHLEPFDTWAGSMMANAGRDPLFWAALDVANHDAPGVGDWCLRCHAPKGWLAGRSEPPGGTVDGCGLVGKIDETDNDFEGVGCHLCHRMMVNGTPPPGQAPLYDENGQFWLDDSDCNGQGEPCRRGPYSYPADGPDPPPHPWGHSPYHENSLLCGNCHNVTSPTHNLIENGVDTGIPYPIERTFKEWQQSSFAGSGTTCQNCHMPDVTESPAFACSFRVNDHPGDLPIHEFAGGNAWIPEVLRLEYPNLFRDAEFAATRDAAIALLESAASVDVEGPATAEAGGTIDVDVTVTNLSGHKLPTGYPEGRRMWLHLEVRDGGGALLFESGAYDPASGILTEDAAIKIYHAEPGVWNATSAECEVEAGGAPKFHFVLNDCYRVDNRIPPAGFTGGTDLETKPVAYTYPETSPGSGVLVNHDVTTYTVPIPPGAATPVTATAALRYQTASREYVEFLRDEAVTNSFPADCIERTTGTPTTSRGEILHQMWEDHGKSAPVEMKTAAAVIPVPEAAAAWQLTAGAAFLAFAHRRRRRA